MRLGALAGCGKAILFASHHLEEAEQAADRFGLIAHGRTVANNGVATVKARLGEPWAHLTLCG